MSNPIWIIIKNTHGCIFEGHQGHWANCYFSNATHAEIESALKGNFLGEGITYEISEMTVMELANHPEAVDFEQALIKKYGKA